MAQSRRRACSHPVTSSEESATTPVEMAVARIAALAAEVTANAAALLARVVGAWDHFYQYPNLRFMIRERTNVDGKSGDELCRARLSSRMVRDARNICSNSKSANDSSNQRTRLTISHQGSRSRGRRHVPTDRVVAATTLAAAKKILAAARSSAAWMLRAVAILIASSRVDGVGGGGMGRPWNGLRLQPRQQRSH